MDPMELWPVSHFPTVLRVAWLLDSMAVRVLYLMPLVPMWKYRRKRFGQLHYIMFPKVHAGICFIGRLSLCLDKLKFVNLFYYLVYFCYYFWISLHFLVLFMSLTILFQLTFIFIYSIFSKKFLVLAKQAVSRHFYIYVLPSSLFITSMFSTSTSGVVFLLKFWVSNSSIRFFFSCTGTFVHFFSFQIFFFFLRFFGVQNVNLFWF